MAAFPPVLILAGGLGTRIRSVCPGLPKSLVPVNGRPFIEHQMRLLVREGVFEVVLCVAHLSEPLVEFVGNGSRFGLNVQYSYDGDQLIGTGGAVRKASELVGSPFAVLYGDSYLDAEFAPVYAAFIKEGKKALMTVYRNENTLIPSNMLVEHGTVVRYDKEDPSPNMVHVDFGLSIFQRSSFQDFEKPAFDLTEVVQSLIARGQLAAYEFKERFFEVGTPVGLHDLEQHLLRKEETSS